MDLSNDMILSGGQMAPVQNQEGQAIISEPQWEQIRQGDYTAFEKVFKTFYAQLLNYGLRFVRDEEEVKDCIQTLFLNIWERRCFLGPCNSIRNYLLASLRRHMLKRLKVADQLVGLDEHNMTFHMEASVETRLIYDQTLAENIALVKSAMKVLPERQKEALYLRFYEDRSFADMAAIMNISTRAVYKLVYKGLDTLNARLNTDSESKTPHLSPLQFLIATIGANITAQLVFG